MKLRRLDRNKYPTIGWILDIFEMGLMIVLFAIGFYLFCTLVDAGAHTEAAEVVVLEDGEEYAVPDLDAGTLYTDSHGATAYGWELIEGIRMMMLECGSYKVSEADKREHCAVLCKQLLYTQTVGGYNGWGTTLWGVMHASNSYIQTAPYIWTEAGNPTDEIAAIFWDVWCNGYLSDFRVQNYRLDYHFCDGNWAEPAYSIDRTYYSRNIWQDFSMFQLDENGVLPYPTVAVAEPVREEWDWFEVCDK